MSKHIMFKTGLTGWFVLPLILAGCGNEKPPTMSYVQDIQPILQEYCIECHHQTGSGFLASGLDMSSYQNLMKGTKFGPVIKAGDSLSSTLVILVEGRADPSLKMPHGEKKSLTAEQTKKLRLWIDQGAIQN
jgi:uncharacterized membrane protein